MIDRLLDFILNVWEDILPFVVIPYYDQGVRLRFGQKAGDRSFLKSNTVLDHGFHWKIPFADQIITHMVKTTTMNISEQSVTTLDGKLIVVAAVVKYSVRDVEKLLLEVNTPVDALSDMVKGIIRDKIIETNWADCNNEELSVKISKQVKHEAVKWGIAVDKITITDLGQMRSLRLLTDMDKMIKS